ncbi:MULTISPECIES: EAL domain-containing protein [unclassified Rhizobium]|uniref:bifunctional diguanylate cyclase/phosphodiesterase n=1 Tax=unclassified Rhizobium TaxID=2613769 RepID=UPI00160D2E43|nr:MULTISPECIES: EAL domain-containing protein [unclassified Rhizobium]MBB3289711.1 diguanylate cyclase (GGDEF)-like protein [Rhizobium sp. BK252]MBB3404654.1 diguanylate cyclase (GGDEF)-like protein [Rhizobium sp. BK289]MBB3416974.1 diguanylate cyclase (GGDEF)-like protein [Rhizobium sp. BK284]MBB3484851.1 diguanylate cyclase (GGDEF)-like protein [Rhizobium sp. BK347]
MPGKLQREILDMLARGASVVEAGNYICAHAERLVPGVLCSIVTVDHHGFLHPLAGNSISKNYCDALDGIKIGPGVGSCGTAAFVRRPIAVKDIFSDPLWVPYRALADILASEHDVRACWSSPILQSDGRVLGAFGFYYKQNRGPSQEEQMIVAECVDLCSLVLEREHIKAENQRLAYFDPLTGLGNRANFLRTLETVADRSAGPIAILLVDIDHLGRLNDAFGHAAGDKLIIKVARMIAAICGPEAVFRVDADEFAIVIKENPDAELSRISGEILRSMEQRSDWAGEHDTPISVSCGGAVSDASRPPDVPTFLQQANLALQHAKQTARGSFSLYTEDLAAALMQRFRTLQSVRSALAEDRIEAHYQPIVRLDTREIVGLEALCCVRTREGDIISGGMFMDALQDISMGYLLTERMLEQVVGDVRYWLDEAILPQLVSVNVSMADFDQRNLCARVKGIFSPHNVPLKSIVIEVTESVYMDERNRYVAQAIEELRTAGLLVALDDFGTGYASLTHLLEFPVDVIKIDKSFVDRILDDRGETIIKALLDMATGLGVRIVAEGVETTKQARNLARLGCSFAQGYLFGRAADRHKTTERLRAGMAKRARYITDQRALGS